MIQIFLKKISIEDYHLRSNFLLLTFFENFNLETTLCSKMTSNFWQLLLNWPQDWLLVLALKEGLVECATVRFKSEVILILMLNVHI